MLCVSEIMLQWRNMAEFRGNMAEYGGTERCFIASKSAKFDLHVRNNRFAVPRERALPSDLFSRRPKASLPALLANLQLGARE